MSADVTVIRLTRIDKGNLRAFASVDIAGWLKIHGCRIIQQSGQSAWVSLPQREWTDKEGNRKYSPVIEVADTVKAAIQHAVLATWQGQQEPDPFSQIQSDEIPQPTGRAR